MYVAIINVPGYLPESEPVEFNNPEEAWDYLCGEREQHEESAEPFAATYSETRDKLGARAEWSRHELPTDTVDGPFDGTGSVEGPTPGYTGDHDLGLVYTVERVGED